MKIRIEQLRAAADFLLNRLGEHEVEEFELDQDFYWEIDPQGLYDPLHPPTELTLGQLSHDWERLEEIMAKRQPPVGLALVWLAAILKRTGELFPY